ncbi:MAG: hypothetical protein HY046_01855 [Acidobacteria bacterium]|nr:hypothetical protein [Acidobacteriota bacterium]
MQKTKFFIFLFLVVVLIQVGCGGSVTTSGTVNGGPIPTPNGGQSAPVSITVTDTPPAGVTIFSFEVTVTGAVLQPGNVQLVTAPLQIEIKRLETESALLNTLNVPAGSYTSIDVTFTNPEIAFKNDSGAAIAGCAAGTVCEIKPAVTGTVSYSGAPFPVTIATGTPLGLLLDVNLANIIDGSLGVNFSAANSIVITQLTSTAGQFRELEHLVGRVTAKDAANNTFTIQAGPGGMSMVIHVDNNTAFGDFNDIGLPNTFASLAVGQIVEVDLGLMTGGTLTAKKVELEDDVNRDEAEGIVTAVQAAGFSMVLFDHSPGIAGISVGNHLNVTVNAGATFTVDRSGLSVPSGFLFTGLSDMMPGQSVQVRRLAASSGTTVVTDRVRLRETRLTAKVKALTIPSATGFSIDNLPSVFSGISQIEVFTSSQTNVEGAASLTNLVVGDTVSIRGLLFKTTSRTSPGLVASKVRKR